jgi:prepilin-type N-terminal cleavage/methylation domain-containing protein
MEPTKLMNQLSKRIRAFTLIELVVVLGVLAVLATMLLPAMARVRGSASRVACADNLKQIGVAFNTWKVSHSAQYPMNVLNFRGGPPTGGSTLRVLAGSGTSPGAAVYEYTVFGVMSNELGTTKILICPSDERIAHSNFTMSTTAGVAQPSAAGFGVADNDPPYFNNFKLSYFLGVNAVDSAPQMILTGDRNIWGDHYGSTVQPPYNNNGYGNANGTQYWMGTNWVTGALWPQWSPVKMHQSQGNVLLTDGSVQQLSSSRLRQQLANSGDNTATAGTTTGPNTFLFP